MNTKLVAKNPTAYHNYTIDDKIEAGIVLSGTEIKSIKAGKVNLKDCYAIIKNGEVFIVGMHISPYEYGNIFNKDPLRDRKLLLHKKEINRLIGLTKQKGYSLVPISLYFKGSLLKVELGIGKGKKLYDKRQDIAKKDAKRKIEEYRVYREVCVNFKLCTNYSIYLWGYFLSYIYYVSLMKQKSPVPKFSFYHFVHYFC